MIAIEEISSGFRLFGEPDYLLHVAVEDTEAYENLNTTKLAALPGIRRAVSHIVMKEVKPTAHLTPVPRTDQR